MTPVITLCPRCGKNNRVPPDFEPGLKLRCGSCKTELWLDERACANEVTKQYRGTIEVLVEAPDGEGAQEELERLAELLERQGGVEAAEVIGDVEEDHG